MYDYPGLLPRTVDNPINPQMPFPLIAATYDAYQSHYLPAGLLQIELEVTAPVGGGTEFLKLSWAGNPMKGSKVELINADAGGGPIIQHILDGIFIGKPFLPRLSKQAYLPFDHKKGIISFSTHFSAFDDKELFLAGNGSLDVAQ